MSCGNLSIVNIFSTSFPGQNSPYCRVQNLHQGTIPESPVPVHGTPSLRLCSRNRHAVRLAFWRGHSKFLCALHLQIWLTTEHVCRFRGVVGVKSYAAQMSRSFCLQTKRSSRSAPFRSQLSWSLGWQCGEAGVGTYSYII